MKTTLSALALAMTAGVAQAAPFDAWTLNGNAQLRDAGATLRLAENNYQAGSAWAPGKVSLAHDFSVAFSFRIGGGDGADGLTFTVQDSTAAASALGGNGGFLGYEGIGTSAAFIYDTWDNGWDTDRIPGANTAAAVNGSLNGWGGTTVGHAYELSEKVLYSWIDYSAATGMLSMYIHDADVKPLVAQETLSISLSGLPGSQTAWIGFTGATGGASNAHDILSVSISAVPEAGAGWLMLAGLPLAWAGLRGRQRQGRA